ncbi:MAG TPA: tetratricopeptide repeat protein [Acidiferrobacteraceae bacterium]|nr:tetratricopeptide repeat protein [Acidiferrobacteraceae bacterium]
MSPSKKNRTHVRVTVTGLGLVLLLLAALAWQRGVLPVPDRRPAPVTVSSATVDPLPVMEREAAQLVGPAPSYTPLFVQAAQARSAINAGNFAGAAALMDAVQARSRIQGWHFEPFATFAVQVADSRNPKFGAALKAWTARVPRSATPYLMRAVYDVHQGWSVRGDGFVSGITPKRLSQFSLWMARADKNIVTAMQLDPTNPYSAYVWLSIQNAVGDSDGIEAAFQQGIAKFPNYYPLYEMRLLSLEPKWGGTPQQMYAFVDTYAGAAPATSPLRMLYVQLYAALLDTASLVCRQSGTAAPDCVTRLLNRLVTESLNRHAYAALQVYDRVDPISFSLELGSILQGMIETPGGDRPAGVLLQLAAHSLHSDVALVAADTRNNNFMMDKLAALVWYRDGRFDNAAALYRRALVDLNHLQFHSRAQQDAIRATLYHDLARVYNRRHRYREVVIYQKAADAPAGPGHADLECAALFFMKLYPEAVHSCSRQIARRGDAQARYWRAQAYSALRHPARALHDYERVARSRSRFRSAAAIAISVIYGNRQDFHGMLRALNSYPYLYDAATEDKEDMAIAYNNRCYARMHLRDLKGALEDCSASLQYGNLPDAYAKQQRIITLLRQEAPASHGVTQPMQWKTAPMLERHPGPTT